MYCYAYADIPRWKYRYMFKQDISNYVYMLGHKLKVLYLATQPPAKEKLQLCPQIGQNIVCWNETINIKPFLRREQLLMKPLPLGLRTGCLWVENFLFSLLSGTTMTPRIALSLTICCTVNYQLKNWSSQSVIVNDTMKSHIVEYFLFAVIFVYSNMVNLPLVFPPTSLFCLHQQPKYSFNQVPCGR